MTPNEGDRAGSSAHRTCDCPAPLTNWCTNPAFCAAKSAFEMQRVQQSQPTAPTLPEGVGTLPRLLTKLGTDSQTLPLHLPLPSSFSPSLYLSLPSLFPRPSHSFSICMCLSVARLRCSADGAQWRTFPVPESPLWRLSHAAIAIPCVWLVLR